MRLEFLLGIRAHFRFCSPVGVEASLAVPPWLALELLGGKSALGNGKLLLYTMDEMLVAKLDEAELGRVPLRHLTDERAVLREKARYRG